MPGIGTMTAPRIQRGHRQSEALHFVDQSRSVSRADAAPISAWRARMDWRQEASSNRDSINRYTGLTRPSPNPEPGNDFGGRWPKGVSFGLQYCRRMTSCVFSRLSDLV
jgi:hypothetical protein